MGRRSTHAPVQRKPPPLGPRDAPPRCVSAIRGWRSHVRGRQSSRPDTSLWLDHGLSLCSAPHHGVCVSSNWPGAAIFGCKTCHCARRRPHISRWTSETAAVDLQPTVCPAVGPRWRWRAKKAKHSRQVISQPGGQRPQLRGLPRSGKAPVMLLIAKSNSNVELSANDNHIGLKKWQRPP